MSSGVRWSLNRQVLLPLIGVCLAVAIGLAAVSQWMAARAAAAESRARLASVSAALADTSFPINADVLKILRQLSGLEFIVLDSSGAMRGASLGLSPSLASQILTQGNFTADNRDNELVFGQELRVEGQVFRAATLHRSAGPDALLILLEPQSYRRAIAQQLVSLPLVTGLVTLILVGAVALAVSQRLVGRITDAQRQVQLIAQGQLAKVHIAGPEDQLTSLTQSVNSMANELRSVWRTIRETERSRLLSQVASGLAHQLRNAITGIHLAVQLHRRDCPLTDHESLKVAEAELARTAAYIQQLLHSAAGKEDRAVEGLVKDILSEAQSLLQTIANHRRIELTWQREPPSEAIRVHDRELLRSAIMNLVLNGLDAAGPGGDVRVRCMGHDDRSLTIIVDDSGPGPSPDLSEHLFDPFVTSKPEGLGVGLTVVRSAANAFHGQVTWRREIDRTIFELVIRPNSLLSS